MAKFGKRQFVRPKTGKIGLYSRKWKDESKYHPRVVRQFLADVHPQDEKPIEKPDYSEYLALLN